MSITFFRARRGIIGNLSVHEAFQFAEEIAVKQLVPVHWDMFAANAVDPEEIRFYTKKTAIIRIGYAAAILT